MDDSYTMKVTSPDNSNTDRESTANRIKLTVTAVHTLTTLHQHHLVKVANTIETT